MARRKILVVDDESKVCDLVKAYLEKDGYEVTLSGNGKDAVEKARVLKPDLIVLDLNLPGMDGIEVFRTVRTFSDIPVIMLTARDDEVDKIVGLQIGADDYVTKPFSPRELSARVAAVLRRYTEGTRPAGRLVSGDLLVDFERHEVKYKNEVVGLTAAEFKLLAVMARNPGRVFTRLQLMDSAFGETYEGYDRTIDAHIKNMRQKLIKMGGDADNPVITVRGVGYKLEQPRE
ncbi:MAG: response regulator transcription factor [Dehalococcoidia bacterium]|nr:response regulator transcription factor [Dehalococcoidia bacterium]MDD5647753.1 response regulator transcription factor [Dehalococcoidia bacterium]